VIVRAVVPVAGRPPLVEHPADGCRPGIVAVVVVDRAVEVVDDTAFDDELQPAPTTITASTPAEISMR
jgi:hypothetical protein